ncbi:cyclic-AMP phosphodiesterase [Epithele typhae]|uniref:cyclic-AMP phosphodiesterase n=1 Tax=Epithele typhae TaxID=378194 RepID=UPI00200776EB|nr:cyclic-AMP phosphodiesterase [Epithele typhae]KAH9946342.1 cyclic-AMP phosphodiesterase [Epithele typhae]
MSSFDIVVVGCGGGPSEHNLSSYLLKAADATWEDGIVALEAGSGMGALTKLLGSRPDAFANPGSTPADSDGPPALKTAADVYARIRCYLVTHAHLDHVNGLVLSAGSVKGLPKRVYGHQKTLEGLAGIFAGDVWPNLASWEDAEQPGTCLLLSPIPPDAGYTPVARDLAVRAMPLSHGETPAGGTYPSAAFFVRHAPSARELLFFGDVEPDAVSRARGGPRTLDVWRAAAPKVPHALPALFIECSWPAGRPADTLYGHLGPEHLAAELAALAQEVAGVREREQARAREGERPNGARKKRRRNTDAAPDARGALAGLTVYVIHVKDDLQGAFDEPIHEVVARQVRELVEAKGLGAEIIAAEQGMHILTDIRFAAI